MCVNERYDNGTGEEVAKVEDFKYLGLTVQSNGECGREVKMEWLDNNMMEWLDDNVRSDQRQANIS